MKKWILISALALANPLFTLPALASPTAVSKASATTPSSRPASNQVNINTADAKTLSDVLVGVGPAKAQAIVEWRKKNGPFKSSAALADVSGVGPALIERNKDRIRLK